MKTIKWQETNTDIDHQLNRILESGGQLCMPCNGSYRIMADLSNPKAVTQLLQAKRRIKKAPSLIFIDDPSKLKLVARGIDPLAKKLAKAFWPGSLTILFDAHADLPRKVVRQIDGSQGRIGVRIPADPVVRRLLTKFGRPLLVSSANRANKSGETSPAQIQKNFAHRIDLFLDAGDLTPAPKSTVVNVEDGHVEIIRPGGIETDAIMKIAG